MTEVSQNLQNFMKNNTTTLATQQTGLNLFDSGTFEQMGRIATQLAQSSLIPETLKTEGNKANKKDLPLEVVTANCFRIVEQSQRWGMSPFAVIDSASVVRGKLQWEGKLVHAAIESMLGIRLNYTYSGEGLQRSVIVSGKFPEELEQRTIDGNVQLWKTDQWASHAYDQRLAYRGAREWARRHAPSVLLGVICNDEELPKIAEVRNVTHSIRRETPLTLSNTDQTEPVNEQTQPAEEKKEEVTAKPEPSKTPATGRQKKDRHHRDVEFVDITERSGNGKTWWAVVMNIGQKSVEMGTFSESLSSSLRELTKGDKIRITFTNGQAGYALEDYELLTVEGGIC